MQKKIKKEKCKEINQDKRRIKKGQLSTDYKGTNKKNKKLKVE